MWCRGLYNAGRWRIFPVGWEIKWRTGWSSSINWGFGCEGAFGWSRIPLFAHICKKRLLLKAITLMWLLKLMWWMQGTSKNYWKKGWSTISKTKKQCYEGRFQALDYCEHGEEEKLTWVAVLFYDGKVNLYGGKGDFAEYLCHLGEGEWVWMLGLLVRFFVAIRVC